jgi:hypothetical protein
MYSAAHFHPRSEDLGLDALSQWISEFAEKAIFYAGLFLQTIYLFQIAFPPKGVESLLFSNQTPWTKPSKNISNFLPVFIFRTKSSY